MVRLSRYRDEYQTTVFDYIHDMFQQEEKRLGKVLRNIVIRNANLGGHPHAYIFNNNIYSIIKIYVLRGQKIAPIDPSLEAEAAIYAAAIKTLDQDNKEIQAAVAVALQRCTTPQQIRDVLPETLIKNLPLFRGIDRQQEPGYLFHPASVQKRQFDQAMNLAANYWVNMLLYEEKG